MGVVKGDRSIIRKNSTGSEFINRRINFIEGSNITLTVASDPTNNEVDVTIASTGGSGAVLEGAANKLAFFGTGSTLSGATGLHWDAVNGRLGVNNSNPQYTFHLLPQTTGIPFVLGSAVSANGAVFWTGNSDNQTLGIFDSGNNRGYGISRYLPAPNSPFTMSTLGGYYAGLGIGGGTPQGFGQPIFGVLASNQSGNGQGSTAFTVMDTNRIMDYHSFLNDGTGKMGLGVSDAGILQERLTVMGRIAISYTTGVSQASGFGKVYVKPSDNLLYYMNPVGTEFVLAATGSGEARIQGSGTPNKLAFFATASTVSGATGLHWNATNRFLGVNISSPSDTLHIGGNIIMTGDIYNDSTSQAISVFGGTTYLNGAYFNVTGKDYNTSPGKGSAELVIGQNTGVDSVRSVFKLLSQDYTGGFNNRFTLEGSTGNIIIGPHVYPVERLTLEGRLAIGYTTGVSQSSGYGKIYVKPSDGLAYYMTPAGVEYDLTATGSGSETIGGSGVANKLTFWANTSMLSTASMAAYEPSTGVLTATKLVRGFASTPTSTATWSVDFNTGSIQYTMLSATTVTVWLQNAVTGGEYTLIVRQDGSGARFLHWPPNVVWAGGTTPTPTSNPSYVDMFKLIYNSTASVYWAVPTLNFSR